jgi:hypothetical protein
MQNFLAGLLQIYEGIQKGELFKFANYNLMLELLDEQDLLPSVLGPEIAAVLEEWKRTRNK